jgi:hypothetical protein
MFLYWNPEKQSMFDALFPLFSSGGLLVCNPFVYVLVFFWFFFFFFFFFFVGMIICFKVLGFREREKGRLLRGCMSWVLFLFFLYLATVM